MLLTIVVILSLLTTQSWAAKSKKYSGINAREIRGFTVYNTITEKDLDSVKTWGGNTVRLMLMINDLHDLKAYGYAPKNNYKKAVLDKDKLAKVKKIADWCQKRKMLLIIDIHETPGLVRWSGYKDFRLWQEDSVGVQLRDLLVDSWKQLSKKFLSYPANAVAYEIFNEPEPKFNDVSAPEIKGYLWDTLQTTIIRVIRQSDRKHTIIASPPYGWRVNSIDPKVWKPMPDLLQDGKIMVTVHMYHPHDYTIPWQDWEARVSQLKAYPGFFAGGEGSEVYWDKKQLRTALDPIYRFQKKYKKIPVIITEFSVVRTAPGAAQYLEDLINIFKKINIGWTYHAYKERAYFKNPSDLMWELEQDELPEGARIAATTNPYDRLNVIRKGFTNFGNKAGVKTKKPSAKKKAVKK